MGCNETPKFHIPSQSNREIILHHSDSIQEIRRIVFGLTLLFFENFIVRRGTNCFTSRQNIVALILQTNELVLVSLADDEMIL